jgi:Zn-dependent protease
MNFLSLLFIQIIPILFAITIHEFSHGYAAYRLGDDTAKMAGRLTLNPLKHLDPLGTIMLFIAHIGWARPVPINPYNFNDIKRDTALVSLAGPGANFASAIVFSLIFNLFNPTAYTLQTTPFLMLLYFFIFINVALGLFNLLPIPPLDGSKIFGALLPDRLYFRYQQFEARGGMLLILIIIIGSILGLNIIGSVILPPLNFFMKLLTGITVL